MIIHVKVMMRTDYYHSNQCVSGQLHLYGIVGRVEKSYEDIEGWLAHETGIFQNTHTVYYKA